jgi:hypothetical protein
MEPTLLQLIGAYQRGIPCPVCGGTGLQWDEKSRDVDSCQACERLRSHFKSERAPEKADNVIRLYRNPDTKRLDDIPF